MYFKLSNIVNDINTIMVPSLCFGCNARLYRGEQLLCTVCRNQIPLTEFDFKEENRVDRIFYGRVKIKKASAFLFYEQGGIVKTLIHYLKYKNQKPIGIFLGDWYGSQMKERGFIDGIDLVIPVPLHKRKLRKRGYNQVAQFAERLAYHLNADYADHLLVKATNTRTQTQKNRIYRWLNTKESYFLSDTDPLQNKNVLLVDDVITTGATMEACIQALHQAPGVTVNIAAMAVVP